MQQPFSKDEQTVTNEFGRFWVRPIVGMFEVSTFDTLPFHSFSIKVIEREKDFQAIPNVVVFNTKTNCQEHICGLGATVREAVLDCLKWLMSEAKKQQANKADGELNESDFVWNK